jgi:hypothetical protein
VVCRHRRCQSSPLLTLARRFPPPHPSDEAVSLHRAESSGHLPTAQRPVLQGWSVGSCDPPSTSTNHRPEAVGLRRLASLTSAALAPSPRTPTAGSAMELELETRHPEAAVCISTLAAQCACWWLKSPPSDLHSHSHLTTARRGDGTVGGSRARAA